MQQFQFGSVMKSLLICISALSLAFSPVTYAAQVTVPDGTAVYLTTAETVIGKKDETAVGAIVRARVWRDVVVDGAVVIKGGTPATVQVSSLTGRKLLGIKGKMSLAAIETTAVDGQQIYLDGGYNKEGKSRMGVALGVGILLFWPALFVPGKAAELPAGTVMDCNTTGSATVAIESSMKSPVAINLGSVMSGFSVEVLYDMLANVEKPEFFDFLITADADTPTKFTIDIINNEKVEPLSLKTLSVERDEQEGEQKVRANIKIKTLAKQLRKGINTFEVSYDNDGERVSEEVILQIEM